MRGLLLALVCVLCAGQDAQMLKALTIFDLGRQVVKQGVAKAVEIGKELLNQIGEFAKNPSWDSLSKFDKSALKTLRTALNTIGGDGAFDPDLFANATSPEEIVSRVTGKLGEGAVAGLIKAFSKYPAVVAKLPQLLKQMPRSLRIALSRSLFNSELFLDGVLEAQQIVEITRERAGVSKKASNRVWVSGIRLIFGFLDETKFYKMVVFGKRTNTSTTWERFRAHYNKAMGSAVMSDKLSEIFTEALNDVQQLTTMKKLLNVTMGGRYDVAENFVDATVRTFRRGFTKKGRIDLERLEYLEGNITNERDHVMDILDAGSSDAMPEIFRQYLRSRYTVYSHTFRVMVDYVNVTLNKKTFTAVVDALRPSTSRGTQRMACDTALSDQFDPFRAQVCSEPSTDYRQFVPWLVLFGLCMVASAVLLVISMVKRTGNIFVNLLLVALSLACAIRVFWFVLWAVPVGQGQVIPTVAFYAAETFAQLLFGLCLAVFSYVLVSANIETFFPEKSTLVGLILIVIMCLAGAATLGYSLAMIIMFQSQMETLTPVLDLRRLVITAAMVLFSLILEASLVLTLVNVKRAVDLPKNAVSRAVIFLVAGSLLLAGWGISVAMTALYYFVDVTTYSVAMISVISFSELFTAICICLYSFFAAQIVTTKRPSAEKARQSLVRNSIHGSSLKEESVPLMYQNY